MGVCYKEGRIEVKQREEGEWKYKKKLVVRRRRRRERRGQVQLSLRGRLTQRLLFQT